MGNVASMASPGNEPPPKKPVAIRRNAGQARGDDAGFKIDFRHASSDGVCPMTKEYNASAGEWVHGSAATIPPPSGQHLVVIVDDAYALVESQRVPFSVSIDIPAH